MSTKWNANSLASSSERVKFMTNFNANCNANFLYIYLLISKINSQPLTRAINTTYKNSNFKRSNISAPEYKPGIYPSNTAQKTRFFPLRIFSVNVTKSAVSCGFGHIS